MAYTCRHSGCNRIFSTKLGRATHERKVHEEHYTEKRTDFRCPHCRERIYFETELGLQAHLEEFHGIPSKTLDWIERKTFENLVYIYNDELYKIQLDKVIGRSLDERERSRLLREGVLVIEEYSRLGKPTVYKLSEEALKILRELEGYDRQ